MRETQSSATTVLGRSSVEPRPEGCRIRVPVLYLHPGFHAFQAIRTAQFLRISWTFRTSRMFKSSLPQTLTGQYFTARTLAVMYLFCTYGRSGYRTSSFRSIQMTAERGLTGVRFPRWTAQNPPLIDSSKPAIAGRPRLVRFYLVASSGRKSVWTLVRQLRGPHLSTWA